MQAVNPGAQQKHIRQSTLHKGTMRSWGPTAIFIIIVESSVECSLLSVYFPAKCISMPYLNSYITIIAYMLY